MLSSIENPPGNIGQYQDTFFAATPELDYSDDDDCHSDLPQETMDRILLMGRNSPGSRPERPHAGPPVGYIPADQPGGPRELLPGRYGCPLSGCLHPFGLLKGGYDRTSLGFHIRLDHGGPHMIREATHQARDRVMALRFERDFCPVMVHAATDGLMADLVRDLEEIREWEHSRRFIIPDTALFNSTRRAWMDRLHRLDFEENSAKAEGQGIGVTPPSARTRRPARRRDEHARHSREETCPPRKPSVASSLTSQRLSKIGHIESLTSVSHGCRGLRRS